MKCKQCGYMNVPNATFCQNCGASFSQPVQMVHDNKTANILCLASVICMLFSGIVFGVIEDVGNALFGTHQYFSYFISRIASFVPLGAVALMVYVRIKYPKNVFGKVLMWIYIILFALLVLFFIWFAVTCCNFIANF